MKKKLLEDLQANDLKDLVKPMIEIDAYKPKIDDYNIVVTFYVEEENPAYDLSRFIEFSSYDVLDTEVSPAPNSNGDYIVFIEFSDKDLAKKIYRMLKAVNYLTGNKSWYYLAYGKKKKLEVKG